MVPTHPFELLTASLSREWRADSEVLKRHGYDAEARRLLSRADELDDAIRARLDELLTIREASAWSGVSYSTIESRIRAGTLPNAGRKGSPRIRRRDLPIAALTASSPMTLVDDVDDLDQLLGNMDS